LEAISMPAEFVILQKRTRASRRIEVRDRLHSSAFGRERVKWCSRIFDREVTHGDFSAVFDPTRNTIFLLTSIFIDSIHSNSCNIRPLHSPWTMERENRSMATKKKAAKKKKKH